jgi:hypothetical protein
MNDAPVALWPQFKALIATPTLPDLGPRTRPERLPQAELEARLERFFGERATPDPLRPWLRGAALFWHDHLEPSHQLSQSIAGPNGSFLHGLMHRREPDYANARYWFHRVGRHGAFLEIARQATHQLVHLHQHELLTRLVPNGLWDPFAFIHACEQATGLEEANPGRALLQRVQEWEFDALGQHVLRATAAPGTRRGDPPQR